jgi:hypothetical protein
MLLSKVEPDDRMVLLIGTFDIHATGKRQLNAKSNSWNFSFDGKSAIWQAANGDTGIFYDANSHPRVPTPQRRTSRSGATCSFANLDRSENLT